MNRALKRFSRLARLRILHTAVLATLLVGLTPSLTFAGGWTTDSEKVLEEAAKSKKLVVYAFLGSDWDSASLDMKHKILSQRKFLAATNEHYLLVEIEVPVENDEASEDVKELMKKYKVSVFPTVIVVNSDGKELDEMHYVVKPMNWYLKKFDRLASLHLAEKK